MDVWAPVSYTHLKKLAQTGGWWSDLVDNNPPSGSIDGNYATCLLYTSYADDSTDENPVVLAKGVDENGKEFEIQCFCVSIGDSRSMRKIVI